MEKVKNDVIGEHTPVDKISTLKNAKNNAKTFGISVNN